MDWLRELLKKAGWEEDKIDALIGDVNKELPKHFVPKSQYNDVVDARKKAEKEVTDRDTQLEELKKSSGDAEALKQQITKLQADNKTAKETYDAEMKALKLDTALKLAIGSKVHDADYAISHLNKDAIELNEDGTVKSGLDDQLKTLQTSKAFLFVPEDNNKPRFKGAKPPEGGSGGSGGGETSTAAEIAKSANESGKAPATGLNPWG